MTYQTPPLHKGERVALHLLTNPWCETFVDVQLAEVLDETFAVDTPESLRTLADALEDYARELTRAAVVLRVRAAGRPS